MKCKQADACINIFCRDECGPLPRCHITLIDHCGTELCCACTDCRGHAEFPIFGPGEYRLRVQSDPRHSPYAQNRWFHLSESGKYDCGFFFNRPPHPPEKHNLTIRLCDEYHTDRRLSDAVFTLWRIV